MVSIMVELFTGQVPMGKSLTIVNLQTTMPNTVELYSLTIPVKITLLTVPFSKITLPNIMVELLTGILQQVIYSIPNLKTTGLNTVVQYL